MVDRSSEVARFRRLGARADVWALSSESSIAKDMFAAVASAGRGTFDDLRSAVSVGDISEWDPAWVARLARVIALQPSLDTHREFAFDALTLALDQVPADMNQVNLKKVLFELLFERGEDGRALQVLDSDPKMDSMYYGYLRTDLFNPFRGGPMASFDNWLEQFNRPFVDAGLSPVAVDERAVTPFDGLSSTLDITYEDQPLVSVIVTTFNPNPLEIQTSVRSILSQTWQNIEILLVDDCSSEEFIKPLNALALEDPRVRLITLPINGGTYRARNAGISNARGKYITGQDTDDWSHPERIFRQVEYLETNPAAPGVTTSANRTDDNLMRVALGHNPERRCEVSLMVARKTALDIGGYIPVRKAADSEFRERIEAWCGSEVKRLDDPLYIIRMSYGSLSRADFRPGWSHHARRAFWAAYKYWHRHSKINELSIDQRNPPSPVTAIAPARIAGREWPDKSKFDICLVSDWRGSNVEHRAAIDELRALAASEMKVSILHLDTPWVHVGDFRALAPEVQQLVSEGCVQRVYLDQDIEVRLLVVRDPATVDFGPETLSKVAAEKVLIVGHDDPLHRPEHMRAYDTLHAHTMAERIFAHTPQWTFPEGFSVNELREQFQIPVQSESYPTYIDNSRYGGIRLRRRPGRPVIGRSAANEIEYWPKRKALLKTYPIDGRIDLRVLGDARGAVRALKMRRLPNGWLQYKKDEIQPYIFWRTIDAMILFDQIPLSGGHERAVLEALASGVPVITDTERAKIYGDAVIAASESTAIEVVESLLEDPQNLESLRLSGKNYIAKYADTAHFQSYIAQRVDDSVTGE